MPEIKRTIIRDEEAVETFSKLIHIGLVVLCVLFLMFMGSYYV